MLSWRVRMWIKGVPERAARFIAWRLLPKLVRRWVVVRAFADATQEHPQRHPDEVGYSAVCQAMR